MSFLRLPYDEAATTTEMSADCRAVEATLHLPVRRTAAERAARAAQRPAPSIRYEDYPREVAKPTIEIDEAASRLAAALQLHLD
jgi:hypothetical protein